MRPILSRQVSATEVKPHIRCRIRSLGAHTAVRRCSHSGEPTSPPSRPPTAEAHRFTEPCRQGLIAGIPRDATSSCEPTAIENRQYSLSPIFLSTPRDLY